MATYQSARSRTPFRELSYERMTVPDQYLALASLPATQLVERHKAIAARELMAKYADLPMHLADATLVALAEERHDDTMFTLDPDFEVYRLYGRRKFRLIP
ncbi:MAG TPA: hypothetical protein VFL65_11980 [Jatrophihabitans sp.]|nr:hypothetical protein [Jatrophihabitans sp.]